MTDEIRRDHADALERARHRWQRETNKICEVCTGEHRTNDCPTAERYVTQILTATTRAAPARRRSVH